MVNRAAGIRIGVVERLGRAGLLSNGLSRGRRLLCLRLKVSEEIAEFEKCARREASPGCLSV